MIAGNILADYFNPIRGTTGDMLLIAQVPKLTSVPSAILPKSGNHLMNNLKTGKNSMCERGRERGERRGGERGEGERGERGGREGGERGERGGREGEERGERGGREEGG